MSILKEVRVAAMSPTSSCLTLQHLLFCEVKGGYMNNLLSSMIASLVLKSQEQSRIEQEVSGDTQATSRRCSAFDELALWSNFK